MASRSPSPIESSGLSGEQAAPWYAEGLSFECTQCGKCCMGRGEYQFVYVNLEERRALARHLGISTTEFTKTYTTLDPQGYRTLRFIDEACVFLKDKQCQVHAAKPTQCRTWPFWSELVASRESYAREVLEFCPGSRRGPRVPRAEIERQVVETEAALDQD